jgi:hypothetical protein
MRPPGWRGCWLHRRVASWQHGIAVTKAEEVVQVGDVFVDQYRRVVWNVFSSTDFGGAHRSVEYLVGAVKKGRHRQGTTAAVSTARRFCYSTVTDLAKFRGLSTS